MFTLKASGGFDNATGTANGGAGTIYIEDATGHTPDQGVLILDNNGIREESFKT